MYLPSDNNLEGANSFRQVKYKIPLYISVILVALGLIVIRQQLTTEELTIGGVDLEGVVTDQPKQRGQSVYFDFQGYTIRTSIYPKISYGDILEINGVADEKGFISFPTIEKIDESSTFLTRLSSFRGRVEEKINKFLPEPQASLLTGVLLGVDKGLPKDFEEALRNTGTIHVVVVSGYNIMIVGGFFLLLAGFIKRKYAITLSISAIVIYTLLTGAQAPTVRAAIMGGLAFSATFLGRQNLPFYTLLLAAFIMLIINPSTFSDIGFQLSFLATAGIILFRDTIFGFLKRIPSPLGEDLTTTLSAQALVIPIIFFHFGQVSLISPIVNALILWTIPLATILGFAIVLFGFIFEPIGQLIAWIAWVPLSIFVWVVQGFSKLPLISVNLGEGNLALLIGYYIALTVIIFSLLKYVRVHKKKST